MTKQMPLHIDFSKRTTGISWATDTTNVIIVVDGKGKQVGWHCVKKGQGCKFCYAERLNMNSFHGLGTGLRYRIDSLDKLKERGHSLHLKEKEMERWKRQRRPRVYFINSMTDTFGEFVPDGWAEHILDEAAAAPQHIFLFLTKRHDRMIETVNAWVKENGLLVAPKHMLFGVSVSDTADYMKAANRICFNFSGRAWLSAEPLVGPLDLEGWEKAFDWIVVGGESDDQGRGRPMNPVWTEDLLDFCASKSIPYFFKQYGDWVPGELLPQQLLGRWRVHEFEDGTKVYHTGKRWAEANGITDIMRSGQGARQRPGLERCPECNKWLTEGVEAEAVCLLCQRNN